MEDSLLFYGNIAVKLAGPACLHRGPAYDQPPHSCADDAQRSHRQLRDGRHHRRGHLQSGHHHHDVHHRPRDVAASGRGGHHAADAYRIRAKDDRGLPHARGPQRCSFKTISSGGFFDVGDFATLARMHGVHSLHAIWNAQIEPNGYSIQQKDERRTSNILVKNGSVDADSLELLEKDEEWLKNELRKNGYDQGRNRSSRNGNERSTTRGTDPARSPSSNARPGRPDGMRPGPKAPPRTQRPHTGAPGSPSGSRRGC